MLEPYMLNTQQIGSSTLVSLISCSLQGKNFSFAAARWHLLAGTCGGCVDGGRRGCDIGAKDGLLVDARLCLLVDVLLVEADAEVKHIELWLGKLEYGDDDMVGDWLGVKHGSICEVVRVGIEERTIVEVIGVSVDERTVVEVVGVVEDGFLDVLFEIGHLELRLSAAPVEHSTQARLQPP
jgi:hypothetical protein